MPTYCCVGQRHARADVLDNCPATANPTQADTDMDGVGDACEGVVEPPAVPGLMPIWTPVVGVLMGAIGFFLRRRGRLSGQA